MTRRQLRRRKPKPRLPIEAAMKLRSHPVLSRKGKRGYERKRMKEQNRKLMKEELFEKN